MLTFADRLLTIAVTATLTSAAWVVVGSTWIGNSDPAAQESGAAPGQEIEASTAPWPDSENLIVPVEGVSPGELADSFADERGGGGRVHEAIDIMAPAGTPVVAAAGGTVESLFRSDAGGNAIYVRSPDRRTVHYYAHLQSYAAALTEGQKVARGQRLGTVGSSGNAEQAAPHLHFAILRTSPDADWWDAAEAVNPYPLLRGR
jgi:murein DD-endopeptidase MepM/ murein hydrolase activator NlpD